MNDDELLKLIEKLAQASAGILELLKDVIKRVEVLEQQTGVDK